MSKLLIVMAAGLALAAGCAENNQVQPAKGAAMGADAKVLRHVVMFQFKDDATPEQIAEVEKAFAALPDKVDVIRDFEWGTDVSVEELTHGYTHCFVVTFANEADRATYLPHPAHQEFVKLLKPHVENVLVVDYWADK